MTPRTIRATERRKRLDAEYRRANANFHARVETLQAYEQPNMFMIVVGGLGSGDSEFPVSSVMCDYENIVIMFMHVHQNM